MGIFLLLTWNLWANVGKWPYLSPINYCVKTVPFHQGFENNHSQGLSLTSTTFYWCLLRNSPQSLHLWFNGILPGRSGSGFDSPYVICRVRPILGHWSIPIPINRYVNDNWYWYPPYPQLIKSTPERLIATCAQFLICKNSLVTFYQDLSKVLFQFWKKFPMCPDPPNECFLLHY